MADGRERPDAPAAATTRPVRALRCADRCDSSESSDSGVAALSCAECSGCSGCGGCGLCSDSTEPASPGSPGSPASTVSAGSAASIGSPWRWPVSRKRVDKCSNLETLVATKLHKGSAPSVRPLPSTTPPAANTFDMPSEKLATQSHVLPHLLAEHCVSQIASIPKHIINKTTQRCSTSRAISTSDNKYVGTKQQQQQQGRITEYYKSQMKPSNGVKKEATMWSTTKTKMTNGNVKGSNDSSDNLNKYIAYLSQTLTPKVMLDRPKIAVKAVEVTAPTNTLDGDVSRVPNVTPHKTEPEKIPLPRLNPVVNCKNINSSSLVKKTDFIKTNSMPQNKASREVIVRGPTKQIKKDYRFAGAKKTIVPRFQLKKKEVVRQSIGINTDVNCIHSNKITNKTQALTSNIEGNMLVNSNPVGMAQISTLPDHLRQLLMKVQTTEAQSVASQEVNTNNTSGETNLDQVPSVNHQTQIHNSDLKTPHRTDNLVNTTPVSISASNSNVSVPMSPTVMLATIRMSDQTIQNSHSDTTSTPTPNHISIANQSGLSNPFVLPLVQNLNGTLLQIPGLVTKVGQNSVIPLANANMLAQTPSNGLTHPQSQMFINGTIVKINGQIHSNLTGINKQIANNNMTNVSYAVSPKNLPSTMPTMIGSKPNFTMNLNQPMFVSSSGFILNSLGNVITTQTNTGISHMQQAFAGNVVLTTPIVHPGVHIAPHLNNAISSLPNIPISPIKLDGISPVFIAPTPQPQQPTFAMPNTKENEIITNEVDTITTTNLEICSSESSLPFSNYTTENLENTEISDSNISNLDTSNGNVFNTPSSEVCSEIIEDNQVEEDKSVCTPFENKDVSMDSLEIEADFDKSRTFITSEETKSSSDSVSLDINSVNDTPPIDSPETEGSKELDEDSLNVSIAANQEFSTSQETSPFIEPKTIRFPVKKHHNDPRNRTPRPSETEIKHCQWNDCSQNFNDGLDLLEHLQVCHVNAQAGKETYRCLWQGCKVYNRPSCSRCWLERHVLSHGGTKLFRCIVDGCGLRFNTHLALQKHVNNHFTENENNVANTKKSLESSSGPKLIRRNGKRLRYRRQPWSARMFDYFDAGIMEGLQYRVVRSAMWRNGGAAGQNLSADRLGIYSQERTPHCITMAGTILARRINTDHSLPECLVRWTPPDVLQDEWMLEKDFVPIKDVPIASLDSTARCILYSSFCASYRTPESQVAQSDRTNMINNVVSDISTLKPLNGFSKVVNGKYLDTRHSHNNNLKTDRINLCVTDNKNLICNVKSDFNVSSESDNANLHTNNQIITGAAKRKQYRKFNHTSSRVCATR